MSTLLDLTVIITAHAEGTLTHRTLRSVKRALKPLDNKYTSEIILHVDNATSETDAYIAANKTGILKDVQILNNAFGDLGSSRNFAVSKARGKYVATIDADDLMSENWLLLALEMLEQQKEPTVAHSEVTVEFEGSNSLVIKHGEIDFDTDSLLSVYANRWNSVIVAPRSLLLEEPYTANSPGYGYEDWHLNCRLIARGVHNLLVPGTAIFVRRKAANSEWLRQIQSMAVLRANPLLSFKSIRSIDNPFENQILPKPKQSKYKNRLKSRLERYHLAHRAALQIHFALKRKKLVAPTGPERVPGWLKDEWLQLHSIDRQIFPTPDLMAHIPVYDTITPEHRVAGALYKTLVDRLEHDSYDYLLFVPWLIRGGADNYAINYANTIARLYPKKNVLVVATLPVKSVWSDKLNKNVSFLNFGVLTQGVSNEIKYRLLAHIIENAGVSHLHIINSELGYNFVELHHKYIASTARKVVVTSFSQSVDRDGRHYGYSHTHVPHIYDLAHLITSDNQTVVDMWVNDYGFDPKKTRVHRQPITPPKENHQNPKQNMPLRLLWAARIAPEKQPQLVSSIGKLVNNVANIDMYGEIEEGSEPAIENLPANVSYKGVFSGFASLPLDKYDALLYTSLFDGMPNTILEAASNNLPIISSAVGGIPEFVVGGDTGILITNIQDAASYASAIKRLADEPTLGQKLSQNALKKIASDFSPSTYQARVKSMLEFLEY